MGTPFYMSPEQLKNFKRTDQRADIFSLGVVNYYLISERFPFLKPGEIKNSVSINDYLGRLKRLHPTPLIDYADKKHQITPELNDIAMMAINPNPEKRYQLMIDYAERLREYVRQIKR